MNRASTLGLVTMVIVVSAGVVTARAQEAPEVVDRRSHELVRLDCSGGDLRRELSLFGNGTVRIRDRGTADDGIKLAELEEHEFEGFVTRLKQVDLEKTARRFTGPSSETLEECRLRLELASGTVKEFRFLRMAALPLSLGTVVRILDDLTLFAEERMRRSTGLPMTYQPRVGDVLVKSDGTRHRIVRVTAEGGGLEIIGLESPLVAYLSQDDVYRAFVSVESRRKGLQERR